MATNLPLTTIKQGEREKVGEFSFRSRLTSLYSSVVNGSMKRTPVVLYCAFPFSKASLFGVG
jgi:hypothetical protein